MSLYLVLRGFLNLSRFETDFAKIERKEGVLGKDMKVEQRLTKWCIFRHPHDTASACW